MQLPFCGLTSRRRSWTLLLSVRNTLPGTQQIESACCSLEPSDVQLRSAGNQTTPPPR